MKILQVISDLCPEHGGPAKLAPEMCQALARRGHEVALYTTNYNSSGVLDVPLDQPVKSGGFVARYFPVSQPRKWKYSPPLGEALRADVKNFDIVHIHNLYLYHNWITAHYCRKYGIPYLISPHGTLDPFIYRRHRWRKTLMEVWFEHRNIKHAAALHFTSEEEMRLARPYIGGTRGAVVPLGVDLQEFQNLPESGRFRERYPEIGGKQIILFLGRINFKKGLDLLASAMSQVLQRRTDVHLVVAGPDLDGWGAMVKGWLKEAGILDRATFPGMLRGAEKLAVLRDAQLFVLPSYSENFGIAVVEAMACGLPVVISDKVNIWREVETAGAGLVGPCEPTSLAANLERLLSDPALAVEMGERGRALVVRQFQWDETALALQDLYAGIIANSRKA